ncbi:MAG: flagellar filament capping protein FliD [Solirubrobacterales bacterium]
MSSVSTTTSGTTGAGGGNMIRLTGMATGLDVDAMVEKMMAAEQTRLDKAMQQQQLIQWKQEAYQDIIKDIKGLQSSFFDSANSINNILSSTNYTPFTVSGVGTAAIDTSVATFTPGLGAQTGVYKVVVNQLASGAGISNALSGRSLSTKLTDINAGLSGSVTLNLNANGAASDTTVTLDNSSGTKTLGDLVNAINSQAGGSVKASFSELTGKFNLNTIATGTATSLSITSESAGVSDILGGVATYNNGKNADITITPPGGAAVTLNDANGNAKTTNNFTIDGMSYNLSSLGTATVTVGQDTQKVYDKIKNFIDKYNAIVDKIQTELSEKTNKDYKPLTDAQKKSMSDAQITAWESKAKQGILRNDNNLQKMLNDLKSSFTTAVSNTGLSIGSYGSSTFGIDAGIDYKNPAHVYIVDETKLKDAIATNTDQILKIFTNVSTTEDTSPYNSSNNKFKEDGIFTRISSILQTNVGFTNTTLNNAILTTYANKQNDYSLTGSASQNTLPDQIYNQQLAVNKLTLALSEKREKYYLQFSRLETAMNSLNSQQASLSSMLGS